MFSRILAGKSGQLAALARPFPLRISVCQNHHFAKEEDLKALGIKEGPERDLVNFPRRLRQLYPDKVRLGFVPDAWFQFFYKKTGVTGPYLWGTGLITYLVSKEIYVLEHEFYNGVALVVFICALVKIVGPGIKEFLSKESDNHEALWKKYRVDSITHFTNAIESEKKEQWRAQGQKVLFDAKKENVHFQLEAAYRARLMTAYTEVKKRLDYQVEIQDATRRIEQSHMVKWIVDNVVKGITPQQEKEALQQCVQNLKSLASKA